MSELEQKIRSVFDRDRVAASDRRQDHIRSAVYSTFRKRRHGPRRISEARDPHYVDVHHPVEFYVVIVALLLSVLDCFFTLTLLQHGSEELNPFMDYFIQRDTMLFFAVKFIVTSVGLIFLILHKRFTLFNIVTGYQILLVCLAMYALLVVYELFLLSHLF